MANNNKQDTVVGVFLDQSQAQQALQALKSAGFDAQIADNNALSALPGDESNLYSSRLQEGNSMVLVNNAGNRGTEAINAMMDAGAENIDMSSTGVGATTTTQTTGASSTGTTGQTRDTNYYRNLDEQNRQYGRADEATRLGKTADEMRVSYGKKC